MTWPSWPWPSWHDHHLVPGNGVRCRISWMGRAAQPWIRHLPQCHVLVIHLLRKAKLPSFEHGFGDCSNMGYHGPRQFLNVQLKLVKLAHFRVPRSIQPPLFAPCATLWWSSCLINTGVMDHDDQGIRATRIVKLVELLRVTPLRVGWPPTPQVYFGPWEGLRVVFPRGGSPS